MSAMRYRPKRRLRSEILPLVVILALPVSLYFTFPSGAIGYSPEELPPSATAVNSFVTLGAERESKLLQSARASWQSDAASRRGVRANLLSCGSEGELSMIAAGIRLEFPERVVRLTEYEISPLPASVAAAGPSALKAAPSAEPAPAFSRSDLLKLE